MIVVTEQLSPMSVVTGSQSIRWSCNRKTKLSMSVLTEKLSRQWVF